MGEWQTAAAEQRNPRGRPRKYSDELLVEAALRVMEREGYAALTIRSLAAELGTSHTTLYNYIGAIEEIEDKAVHRLTDQLPLPQSSSVPELRVELIAFLVASRRLMLHHPGVMLSRHDSAAAQTFMQVGDRWQGALLAYAPDRKTVHLALGALLSTVALAVEAERRLGAEYEKRLRSIPARPSADPVEQYGFEQYLDAMIDLVLPGLSPASRRSAS
ncbi:TetR/AcrR family transcriptional regulator [Solimonas sp. SE-A11]|uniref:TetR/AcrR family transcriptional regulator n=1 Tax=Solimonas sp. SE-A11 TaxID=3054954 RepID=UPI00259CC034|nr:TetR/AcrR family transcriptional regulator [Solimonas sp. SE-A11]MDM4769857.1 TetR/AcrR family transcriptional regulator [Solimonas sp. SE-A11]